MTSPKTPSPERERIGVRFVSDAVKRDHRTLEKLYAALTDTGRPDGQDGQDGQEGHGEDQRELLEQRFCWELARHLVAMGLFIFPGTSRRAKQGNQNAQDRQRDFALLRAQLLGLVDAAADGADGVGSPDGDGQGFRKRLEGLRENLAQHIKDVERTDLVAIEKVLSGEESERLARDFEATVVFIPPELRAEPEGCEVEGVSAPFESVCALLDASVEELKCALERFLTD